VVRERRGLRIVSAVAIFLTAVALQRACTLAWGRSAATDAVRYEISVVGLSRVPLADDVVRTDCRWWPRYGDAALCAPAATGEQAFRSLRFAYPMLQVAMWIAVVSVLLQALRVPRHHVLQALIPATAAALTLLAIVYVRRGAADGLAVLDALPMGFDAAGYRFAVAAATLSVGSALLLLVSVTPDRAAGAEVDA